MDQEDSVGTEDRPIGMTIRSSRLPEPSQELYRRATEGEGSIEVVDRESEPWASNLLDNIESVIQRYPWPTVLLGMGIGYLLAQRVR
jgi:hypothetical protein